MDVLWPLHYYVYIHVLCTCISIVPGIKEKKNVGVQLLFYEGYEVGMCSNYNNYTTFMPPISYIMRYAFHLVNYLSKKW